MPRKTFILPSAFTAGNLFCGFFAVISAIRGDLELACWLVVVAGFLDFIDGKVALISGTASSFGMELDSLADLVSFGMAPGIIMHEFFLKGHGDWSWLISFLFCLCGALRLARFNVETGGPDKKSFKGLPIPMAAVALISFIPFSRAGFFLDFMVEFNYSRYLVLMILLLAGLMVSNVEYPCMPRFGMRTLKGRLGLLSFVIVVLIILYYWRILMFPVASLYVFYGLSRAILLGIASRRPEKN
ncbi:MAG: CDP-diacylglycerol--serine O-phosphatidyltransferase [Gemmatimonadota bacterium]|nr:CDP-diacylglycerol--serine O-phosphatidyltransferase [Gemmatimonadota bacterium]